MALRLLSGRGPDRIDRWSFGLLKEDKSDCAAQGEQEQRLKQKNAPLKAPFNVEIEQHLLQKLDAPTDRSVLPRLQKARPIAADAIDGGHFIQRPDERVDAGRTQSFAARSEMDLVLVSAAIRRGTRDGPATEHICLPLATARQKAEYHENVGKQDRHQRDGRYAVGRLAVQSERQRSQVGSSNVRNQPAEYKDTGSKEPEIVEHMVMADVANFVTEHRLYLVRREIFQQTIGEDNVAEPRQNADHHSIGHAMTRVPDQNVAASKTEPAGRCFEAPAQGTGRHRLQTEHQTYDPGHGREDDQHRRDPEKMDGLGIFLPEFRE